MKKVSYEGRTYISDGHIITIRKGTQKLGTLPDETVKVADLDQVNGMNDMIKYIIESNAKLDGVDEVSNFTLISAGLCPILAGWEDGEGNALNLEGWGKYTGYKEVTRTIEQLEEQVKEITTVFYEDIEKEYGIEFDYDEVQKVIRIHQDTINFESEKTSL